MRRLIIIMSFLTLGLNAFCDEPCLKFNKKGEFKIVQFTDTHLDPHNDYRLRQGDKTFARISRIVRSERPDFIVFTGDVVTGAPASKMWHRLIDSLNVLRTPFCVVLGNHDAEQDLSRQEIANIVTSSPFSLNTLSRTMELDDIKLDIGNSLGGRTAFALYCMDSHDYSTIKGVEGYGWFTEDQVEWLRRNCLAETSQNGGKSVPSIAFFHIVLPEYLQAWRDRSNSHIGRAAEEECPGALNTGMYSAMVETGNIIGTFVGHDHDIDYIVSNNGIALGYGRFSGDDTTYNNLRPGGRVIILEEGKRAFRTFIKEDDGRIVDHVRFDNGKILKVKK